MSRHNLGNFEHKECGSFDRRALRHWMMATGLNRGWWIIPGNSDILERLMGFSSINLITPNTLWRYPLNARICALYCGSLLLNLKARAWSRFMPGGKGILHLVKASCMVKFSAVIYDSLPLYPSFVSFPNLSSNLMFSCTWDWCSSHTFLTCSG